MNAKRVAVHESSHAFVGWVYGFNLSLVTISPPPGMTSNAAGLCKASKFEGRTEVITDPTTLTAERFYLLSAGRQADEIYFPTEPNLSGADFAEIASMLPADDVVLDMYRFNWKKENLEAFYQRFKKPVEKLLRSRKARKEGHLQIRNEQDRDRGAIRRKVFRRKGAMGGCSREYIKRHPCAGIRFKTGRGQADRFAHGRMLLSSGRNFRSRTTGTSEADYRSTPEAWL